MGQSNESSLSSEEQLAKTFRVQSRVKEHNLTYLDQLSTHKPYLLREMTFKEESQLLEKISQLKSRQDMNSPHLTNLAKYEHDKHQDLCSKYFKIRSLWQYPRRTLTEDINERALQKRPYNQQQLSNMIKHIALGCLTLQQYRITHECLTSKTVVIDSSLAYRVVDPLALPMHPNLDMIYHKRNLKNIYLSPQQCRIIDEQDIRRPVVDPYREDVFTAGMLVLEAALLKRQDQCYEDDCARMNFRQLDSNLKKVEDIYGIDLRNGLAMMLIPDTSKRVDWLQITKMFAQQKASPQKVEYIHRVSAGNNPQQQRLPVEQRPIRSSLIFRYDNPHQIVHINPKVSAINGHHTINVLPPHSNLTNRNTVIVRHQPPKQLIFPDTTVRTSPVQYLNSETQRISSRLQSPISQNPQEFHLEKEEPIFSIDEFKNGGRYEGYKLNGKRQGYGKYTYQQGGRYEGEWKNDLMCGKGKLYYQSGKIAYDGYLQNDLFHGSGTLYNQNPERLSQPFNYENFQEIQEYWVNYEGQFRQDMKEGQGTLLLTNGEVLQASFHEDKVEGQGWFFTMAGQKIHAVWHQNRLERQLP